MTYTYSPLGRLLRKRYRCFFPVPKSPWTSGKVEDICDIHLVPPEKLKSFFLKCVEKLSDLKGEEVGDYLEFGVFNGSSIGSMYLALQEKEINEVRLFGFDAFEGLPAGSENEDGGVRKKGFYACPYEKTIECLVKRNVDSKKITWVKGWYDETLLPNKVIELGITNIGIAFIDCDTYSSSKTVLNFLAPLIKSPCILCFDDRKLNDLDIKQMGEYKAFNEFMKENIQFEAKEITSYNRKSKSFLIQVIE